MKNIEKISNFLANDTEFEGKLKCDGTIRIDGHFKGEILATGTLVIGELGIVESDIHAHYIIVSGEVHGKIVADEKIEIRPPGKVFGNIQAPCVVLNEGVIFEGTCQMQEAKEAAEKPLVVMGPGESEIGKLSHSSPEDSAEENISETNP